LFIIIGLSLASLSSFAKAQPPPIPLTILGYVNVQTVNGANVTMAGLSVYVKDQNVTLPNVSGSMNVTNSIGEYQIGINASNVPPPGTPLDMWVQNVNVTRIIEEYPNPSAYVENLTVIETTPPTIQVLWPQPGGLVAPTQPLWVNATVTDNLLVNWTSLTLTLNQTQLVPASGFNVTGLVSNETGPPAPGFYVASLNVSDVAGNTASETWNFTSTSITPPTVDITSPTTAAPEYTQSGKSVTVAIAYTEANPLNWTVTISNATDVIGTVSNTTAITAGTGTATANVPISQTASNGMYNVNVIMYDIYGSNGSATEVNALVVDNTPPLVTITSPTSGAYVTSPPIWINGTITDLYMGSATPAVNDSRFSLAQWVASAGAFSFSNNTDIPDGTISANVTFTDLVGNVGSGTVTFTVSTGPYISTPYQNPPGNYVSTTVTLQVPNATSVTVSTNITDVSGISSATLFYNNGSGWVNQTMTSTGNLYTGTIPGQVPGTTVSYYITATNNLNVTATTVVNSLYFEYNVIPEFTNLALLLFILAIGSAVITVISRSRRRKTRN